MPAPPAAAGAAAAGMEMSRASLYEELFIETGNLRGNKGSQQEERTHPREELACEAVEHHQAAPAIPQTQLA
jgi:hypothetical protein